MKIKANKLIATLMASGLLLLSGCTTLYPNQPVVNKMFPKAQGESLAGQAMTLPDAFSGEYHILLLGYVQGAQFDIDRWLIGLDMKSVALPVYEIPTIQGWIPSMIRSTIDNGMRKGIPEEIWRVVVTVYEDGESIQAFTGNENPRNSRTLLLSPNGTILYAHDRGFSVAALNELISAYETDLKASTNL